MSCFLWADWPICRVWDKFSAFCILWTTWVVFAYRTAGYSHGELFSWLTQVSWNFPPTKFSIHIWALSTFAEIWPGNVLLQPFFTTYTTTPAHVFASPHAQSVKHIVGWITFSINHACPYIMCSVTCLHLWHTWLGWTQLVSRLDHCRPHCVELAQACTNNSNHNIKTFRCYLFIYSYHTI